MYLSLSVSMYSIRGKICREISLIFFATIISWHVGSNTEYSAHLPINFYFGYVLCAFLVKLVSYRVSTAIWCASVRDVMMFIAS